MLALLTSLCSIIQVYLTEGSGSFMSVPSDDTDWPLYISHLPDIKINCGAIYDTAGKLDGKSLEGDGVVEHPGFELRIRSSDYEIGYGKIEEIVFALDGIFNEDVALDGNTYRVQNASRVSTITPISEAGTGRKFVFTVNFLVSLKKI